MFFLTQLRLHRSSPRVALRQYLFGALDEFGLDDHWNDAEGALAFLLELAGPGSSIGSYSLPWYVRGLGGIDNKSSDCASWIPPPSYSAT